MRGLYTLGLIVAWLGAAMLVATLALGVLAIWWKLLCQCQGWWRVHAALYHYKNPTRRAMEAERDLRSLHEQINGWDHPHEPHAPGDCYNAVHDYLEKIEAPTSVDHGRAEGV